MRRLAPAAVLLALIFAVATVLAWQAYDAARSHRQSTERLLEDYVRVAGWQFGRLAQAAVEGLLRDWGQAGSAPHTDVLPSPAEFNARPTCKCQNLQALTTFRVTGERVEVLGEPLPSGTDDWILGFARSGDARQAQPAIRVASAGNQARVILVRAAHRHGEEPRRIEGFAVDAEPLRKALRDIVDRRPLLPPTLGGSSNDLVAVETRAPDGALLLASAGATGTARADGQLDAAAGALAYTVRLRPDAASRLVIGGLPASKLPLLLGLLALTALLALAALQQLRREHQLARIRADFVASVSHELRTPLAQIRLFSETLLLNRVRSEAEGRRSLEIIQQESRRLTHLVDNVLFFSRAERGLERIAPAPTPLVPLTAELVEAFRPVAGACRATLRLDVLDAPDAVVDPAAFKQILLNLLDNAVKYGPAGQTIVVSVERRNVGAVITVSDQGPGVPPEARARIFEPYSRLVTASTSAIAGTGIGLAVVRRLVDLHGASVHVEDAPGGGARFVVVFRAPGVIDAGEIGARRSATA